MLIRRTVLLLSFVLLWWAGLEAAPQRELFTLEQILSAPFPTGLVAAPRGGQVAWVFNATGGRNIWVAEPPDYRGRAITSYQGDDGQEISDLEWTPDGSALVYVRGGRSNRQGEYPNPLSDPGGVEQAVWVISIEGGEPRKLDEGSSPSVSPKGDRVAFVKKSQIWWAPLDASKPASQLMHTRGSSGSLRWSSDGSRLAFVSNRGDHSFVGVYHPETNALRYLEPTVDSDSNPVWSPDGGHLAYLRRPASRLYGRYGPHRTNEPWSIRAFDVSTGRGSEVWRAEDGRGSVFRNVAADNQLLWAATGHIVFPWERDGWTHLYSVRSEGGEAKLLTPGDFEVEFVGLSPDGRRIVFNSNQNDLDRRHLWDVTPEGGPPRQLTRGTGIQWSPIVTSDGKALAFLRSDAKRPAHPVIQLGEGQTQELAPGTIPGDFPAQALLEPQSVVYSAADGMSIHAQLFLPGGTRQGERRQAVVYLHGGPRSQMLLGWSYRGYYHNAYAFNQYLASRGYVVLSINFRSGTGYGLEFREALDYGPMGASEFNDVLGAGLYLQSRADVDPERIGLWGGSYGGYHTAMGLARASDLFAAGVDLHGVHDRRNRVIREYGSSFVDPEERQAALRLAYQSSPMASLDSWSSPVLLIHGDDDRNVPFHETVDLVEELRKRDVEIEQLIFPDEVHGFLTHAHWLQAYRAAFDFFERHLNGGAKRTLTSGMK